MRSPPAIETIAKVYRLTPSEIGVLQAAVGACALPILFGASAREALHGGYYGPVGSAREIKGPVGPSKIMPQASDREGRRRLWDLSAALTGVGFG